MKILIKNALSVRKETFDLLINHEKIVEIGKEIQAEADQVIELDGETMVSAGWLDIHTHAYKHFELYADDPDEMGYKLGVTTVVDAGTTGADVIGEFANEARKARTRVHALINIAHQGIVSQDELAHLEDIDGELIEKAIQKNPEFIIGLKARMSASVVGKQGIEPLLRGKNIAHRLAMPMMIHIGTYPPRLEDVLELLEAGDIVTHIFNGKENGIYYQSESILSSVLAARERGVRFDIGHGRDSFSFDVASRAFSEGFLSDTISSDIYRRNRIDGPVHSLVTTMNKLLCVGYNLEYVIDSVTSRAAEVIGLRDRGQLKEGMLSDLTFFKLEPIHETLTDSVGATRILDLGIVPKAVFLRGAYYEIK